MRAAKVVFEVRLSVWGLILTLSVLVISSGSLAAQGLIKARTADPDSLRPALEAFFAALRNAYAVGNSSGILTHYDVERMFAKINTGVPTSLPRARVGKESLAAFTAAFAQGLTARSADLRWKTHVLTNVKRAEAEDEVIALMRQRWYPNRVTIGRYWLRKTDDAWRITDFEFLLEDDVRATESGRIAFLAHHDKINPRGLVLLRQAQQFYKNGQPLEALRRLAAIPTKTSNRIKAVRWTLVGRIHLDLDDRQVARTALGNARATGVTDLPALDVLEGLVQFADKEYGLAAERFKYLLAELGPQQELFYLRGSALRAAGRSDEAITSLRQALSGPQELLDEKITKRAIIELAAALPTGSKTELTTYVRNLPDFADSFETLAEELLAAGDDTSLGLLVEAARSRNVDPLTVTYFDARLRHLREEYSNAAALLEPVLVRVHEKDKRYADAYLLAMNALGHMAAGYAKTPDRSYAFYRLAHELATTNQPDRLLELTELHRRSAPDDAWVDYYTGIAHSLKGEFSRAKRVYAAARGKAHTVKLREAIRSALVRTWFDADEGIAAYQTVAPNKRMFEQLAYLYANARRSESLAALVKLHGKVSRNDEDLPLWRAEVSWSNGNHANAAATIEQHWERVTSAPNRLAFFENRLIRSLLHASNAKAAKKKATASTERDGDPYFQVIVDASLGDVADATKAFRTCIDEFSYDAQYFYNDEDVGVALRSADYSALHTLYPPTTSN